MRKVFRHIAFSCSLILSSVMAPCAGSRSAGEPDSDLIVAANGTSDATIVVAAEASEWERRAAADLQKYIHLMTGAEPPIVNTIPQGEHPVLVVGRSALEAEPTLGYQLANVAKKDPVIRADAIVIRRVRNRVYLLGSNDESHYFAATWLLNKWGCRWYLPTEFGETIPEQSTLTIGQVNLSYAPPFEIRHYWLSWNADRTGALEFRRRNFMTETSMVGMGHALGTYTGDLAPSGKTAFNVPFSNPATAQHVARKIEADYASGKDVSLAIEDGTYSNDWPGDKALISEFDRYSLRPSLTDAMLTLYNNIGAILRSRYPSSRSKLGGMAYSNVTLPPKLTTRVEPNIVMWLAPIDIDPNHGIDDPRSPPRQEYRDVMYRWAELVGRRLAIYDYDQGMLIWRDIPNPSHQAFAQDVRHYAKAGILGIGTESRGATATTFLNLFFRGQLMWDPAIDVRALLSEFYPKFYGPAAFNAAEYWNAIFSAWESTFVTEHEYMAASAIYTPELVEKLRLALERAEVALASLRSTPNPSRNERLYLARMRFTRLGFNVLQNYLGMVTKASRDNAYAEAAELGRRALTAREALTAMNPSFTTYKNIGEVGPAWFPGEVEQVEALRDIADGPHGKMVVQTPLSWSFRVSAPLRPNWTYDGPEGALPKDSTSATEATALGEGWRPVRTDTYLQAQGVLGDNGQSSLGHYWYRTNLELPPDDAARRIRIMFPGLFNETWLYVNGKLLAHRAYQEPWWMNDYKFEWDVDVTGSLRPGTNVITLRGFNPHHFGGIFRRPFLYRPAK